VEHTTPRWGYYAIAESERETFFRDLGERAETEISHLHDALAGPDPPNDTHLANVGRLDMAGVPAKQRVLGELILFPAAGMPEDEDFGENESSRGQIRAPARFFLRGLD
jgi:hypothetical protein